jgi:hypothetical protein
MSARTTCPTSSRASMLCWEVSWSRLRAAILSPLSFELGDIITVGHIHLNLVILGDAVCHHVNHNIEH